MVQWSQGLVCFSLHHGRMVGEMQARRQTASPLIVGMYIVIVICLHRLHAWYAHVTMYV